MIQDYLKDPLFVRQLIMDHYQHPHHKGLVDDDTYQSRHMASSSCIDDLTVQVQIVDGVLKDVRFDGVGCTISTASVSMMCDLVIGKTIPEALQITHAFMTMVELKETNEALLGEAVSLRNVGRQANRIHCATIGWQGLWQLLEEALEHEQ